MVSMPGSWPQGSPRGEVTCAGQYLDSSARRLPYYDRPCSLRQPVSGLGATPTDRMAKMQLRRLGRSGLKVPPLCFGGNIFGWTADEPRSFELLDALLDLGFNF